MMRDSHPLVSFAIVGAQKCGTTALFHYLRVHPGLDLARGKEAHFFDDETRSWHRPDYSDYHRLFRNNGRLAGEATPIYLYWPRALARMRRYNPQMRLIVLVRCPVARAWSHWQMEFASGRESQPFAWAIRGGRARVDDPAAPDHHRVFSYVERGLYGKQLDRLLSLFPRDQLLTLSSAELRLEPSQTLQRVCDFLGVDPLGDLQPHDLHVTRPFSGRHPITQEDVAYLRSLFEEDLRRFEQLAGFPIEPEAIDTISLGRGARR